LLARSISSLAGISIRVATEQRACEHCRVLRPLLPESFGAFSEGRRRQFCKMLPPSINFLVINSLTDGGGSIIFCLFKVYYMKTGPVRLLLTGESDLHIYHHHPLPTLSVLSIRRETASFIFLER
jgi:hypothetical protein